MIALLGILTILVIAVAASTNRAAIRPRVAASAFAIQAGIAVFALYLPFGKTALATLSTGVNRLVGYADEGIQFLFGPLGGDSLGYIVAFRVLPVIIFVSSVIAVLYHLRIMQRIVLIVGGGLRRLIGTRQVESLCAAANIFVGMIEAPLVVRPYLSTLTRSQLFAVMAVGLSSVSGAILVGYASMGIRLDYLLPAAFMAAPGGLLMAKILMPEALDEPPEDIEALRVDAFDPEHRPVNVIEAAAEGAMAGLQIAVRVGAMLLAFVALLALLNDLFGLIGMGLALPVDAVAGWFGVADPSLAEILRGLTLEKVLGWILAPLMVLLGIPWDEATIAGNLVGQKTILNEFIAFAQLAEIKDSIGAHTEAVVTFALCGFANLQALAIIFGGLGAMVPERKHEIARLGLRATFAGILSNLMSAGLASLLLRL